MRNGIFLFVVFFSLIGVNTCETELLSTCNMAGKMMKAVIAEAGKLVLVERPVPAVKVGEVLVKVHFTAINRADTLQRKGLYPVPAGQTDIFGLEMSGVVEGKDGETWKAGTEVMSLLNGGGYAEYVAVNENLLMPVPKGLDLRTAAGIPETWLTAFQLLHTVTGVKSGDTVVVHAGGSGATIAGQMGTLRLRTARLGGRLREDGLRAVRGVAAQRVPAHPSDEVSRLYDTSGEFQVDDSVVEGG